MTISINPPTDLRIVVTGLEIIESRFGIVVVAAVAKRVDTCEAASGGEDFAPRVVVVACYGCAGGIDQSDDVALQIQYIVVGNCCGFAVCSDRVDDITPEVQVEVIQLSLSVTFPLRREKEKVWYKQ